VIVFRGRLKETQMITLDDGTIKIVVEIGISDTELSVDVIHSVDLENFTISTTDIDDICSSVAEELKALFRGGDQ
jgi:hypothetical protein